MFQRDSSFLQKEDSFLRPESLTNLLRVGYIESKVSLLRLGDSPDLEVSLANSES